MERSTDNGTRRRRTRVMGVSVALLIMGGIVAGCSTTPRAVVWIPFTYTAQMGQPTLDNPSGSTTVVLVACLDQASAVQIETPAGGYARLDWDGGSWATDPLNVSGRVVVTPVLQPGCGTLTIGPIFLHATWPVPVTVSKVAP